MENTEIETFELHLDLVLAILKSQDYQVINSFKKGIAPLMEPEYVEHVVEAALYCLADLNYDTFVWALHNYDTKFYVKLRQKTVASTVQRLIKKGFIPGQDFSAMPGGGLIVNQATHAVLSKDISPVTTHLLKEILHVFS